MAASQPAQCEPAAPDGAMGGDRLGGEDGEPVVVHVCHAVTLEELARGSRRGAGEQSQPRSQRDVGAYAEQPPRLP